MPTYAYACKDCSHAFDIAQKFSDDSLTVCPECQGTLRKKFGSVGVSFKGSGFYRTDSRAAASSGTDASKRSGSDGAPSSASGNGSSDSSSSPAKAASGAGSSSAGSAGSGSSSSSD
ncbi:FmdB family transcriptional regulator [Nesterenkonia sp. LB17]|uniref:FmdB family zinc ribbon protein n=1 Tax=unclassified Nesterenkonia TaxID=2629769 RepID=UPI001F4C96E6|nr:MULTISPECIES: FmdB family zinc ribbon protein [unclassified Nesterenkonia]MCH8561598.1 FmdB family transcriptional regulator [Nesterenkonia sp. DZ6]MCH8564078.1 FmdB family transcriptional regulator [Nesterenkonia sp. YGD6]MCH8566406.1 FmdB family transcriptional regulator [Nesterenkonia sp. LB17]MCH8572134.1 FmdB family transcriptional regulator [Nesterenkonia sp. AY15]